MNSLLLSALLGEVFLPMMVGRLQWLRDNAGWIIGAISCSFLFLRFLSDYRKGKRDEAHGPELVVKYDRERADALSDKLVVHSTSKDKTPYNVEVKDLVTEDGRVSFVPKLVPCVTSGEPQEFIPNVEKAPALSIRNLKQFLSRSYKDKSMDELFSEKQFWIVLEYDDGKGRSYRSTHELLYRHWKQEIREGRIEREKIRKRKLR